MQQHELTPMALFPCSYSTTLSTNKNGYLWGRIPLISSRLKIVLTLEVNADISAALLGAGSSTSAASASSSAKICVGERVVRGADGATNAVAAVAKVARRASFILLD